LEETLEKVKSEAADNDAVDEMDNDITHVMSDIDSLKHDLEKVKSLEEQMRHTLTKKAEAKASSQKAEKVPVAKEEKVEEKAEADEVEAEEHEVAAAKTEEVAETKDAEKEKDTFAEADQEFEENLDDTSFLQLMNVNDDMNGGLEDDEGPAPALLMNRMRHHSLVQNKAGLKKHDGEEGVTFGISGDGSGRQFEVSESGETLVHDPPPVPADMVKPNDISYRVDPHDHSMKGVPTADVDPADVRMDSTAPGTTGKQWSLAVDTNTTNGDDAVCVCKRRGAPRGFDRVRCKRHPTPTPAPTPVPVQEPNIIQCTNGTWPRSDSVDSNTRDIICIYFPARAPVPTPVPTPTPGEPEYPPECYDPRNEFVAEGVEKVPFSSSLLQQGYEVCGC